tara:strand:- start:36 stop:1016 length:981 start_codon:yes stop_codon:yes gene_type:complete
MMGFDKFYENLDEINPKEDEKEEENSKNDSKIKKCCSEPQNSGIDHQGQSICMVCDTILNKIVDNPEWRYYGCNDTKKSDPTRCGMPVNVLLPISSIGSDIKYNYNPDMYKIRKLQQWNSMPYKERSLYKVFLEISEICHKHNLPSIIINEAKSIYNIISNTKISRGSNRIGIKAATVYFACKECNVPRSSKEIADIFNIDITVMTKGVKKCQEILYMNKLNKNRFKNHESIYPIDFIERFCNKLNIDQYVDNIKLICKITIDNNIISENTPPSIAAGCIFLFLKNNNIKISKKQISETCRISEVTINKCTKKLELHNNLFTESNI